MSGQRQAVQKEEACGDHVFWQPRLEEIAKLVDLRLPSAPGDNMRDQRHLAHQVIPRQHDGGLDVGVLHQDVFDLLELDPVAADLHLMVEAPDKLKISVSAPAGQVSGPVQPRSAARRERVAKKASPGLIRVVEIAATHAGASDA